MTENQLASIINHDLEKQGASGPSFQTIVAFGKHSAEPHYAPQNARLKKNKLSFFSLIFIFFVLSRAIKVPS